MSAISTTTMASIMDSITTFQDWTVVYFVVVALILFLLAGKVCGVAEKYRKLWISAERGKKVC
jgi:cell division protein FtsW (lipid II flippase)